MRRTILVFGLMLAVSAVACAGSPDPGVLANCPAGERPAFDLGRSIQGDAVNGGMLWARECMRCHARQAFERDSRLFRDYPRLDCPEYLADVSDGYLHTVIAKGGEAVGLAKTMKPFEDKLSANEIADLIAYIRSVEQTIDD